jgi:hypothetical protein
VKKRKPRLRDHFTALQPWMKQATRGSFPRHKLYSLCVKASLSKCFELNLSVQSFSRSKSSFFAISALRGICEDLIVLRFMKGFPSSDRDALIRALSRQELASRIKLQDSFFGTFRPQQPVLRLSDVDAEIDASEAAARSIWNRHGWPGMKKGVTPQIRQIAEKQGAHQLAVLYDFLYRLTSAGVHFSVQSLLRSGWGASARDFTFSPRNFHAYFDEYYSLYGAFLFCLYFEFFGSLLRPSARQRAVIDEIRRHVLFTPRWPEMVTFEEMNQRPPKGGEAVRMMVSAVQATSRKRLIPHGANYKNHSRSVERRLISDLLKFMAAERPPPSSV